MINDIANIAFEHITGDYHWGKYGDFEVIINIKTGYINATHLCKQTMSKNDRPKQFGMWKQNASTTEFIEEMSHELGLSQDDLFVVIAGGQNTDIRGTYVHPDLIPHIASWASPKFARLVSRIINAYMILKYKRSIAELQQQLDKITEQDNNHVRQLEQVYNIIRDPKNSIYHMKEQILGIIANVCDDNDKLTAATIDRVPKCPETHKNEVFTVYQNPITKECKMIRRQQKTLQTRIKTCNIRGFSRLIYYNDSPNAVNLGSRLKCNLPPNIGRIHGCNIILSDTSTTEDLLRFIRETDEEKRNV